MEAPFGTHKLLESIRRRDYYASISDKGEGIAAISVPVVEPSSVVVAALAISGPDHRWTTERMQRPWSWLRHAMFPLLWSRMSRPASTEYWIHRAHPTTEYTNPNRWRPLGCYMDGYSVIRD